jgi:D-alanyl-D-alanine carboxypeptidase/D-alanyl-D-alanine-endopeptidase (penicillin-binding protein 4)
MRFEAVIHGRGTQLRTMIDMVTRRGGLIILGTIGWLPAFAAAQPLSQQIDAIFDALPGAHTLSALVESEDGATVYYSHFPDVGKRPASVTKFFVVGAAMELLGQDHRFVTRVYRDGTIDGSGVLIGDLILLGNHDFTWAADYYPGSPRFALDRLAEQLYELGLRSVTGTVRGFGYLMYAEVPSNSDAVNAFRDALTAAGISVGATATSTSFSPPGVAIAEWRSMPLPQACRDLMKVSDNDDAQALMRHLAYELRGISSDSVGASIIQDWLTERGVDMTGSLFFEGAGLSHSNRVSARQAVGLTRTVLNTEAGYDTTSCLPIGGIDGTLGSRYTSGPAFGRVHAKTGTLTGVVTLSGYVLNPVDRQRYLFAFMMNDISGFSSSTGRAAIDDAVQLLATDVNGLGGAVPGIATLQSATGNAAQQTVTLAWSPAIGATGYNIYRSSAGFDWTLVATVGGTTHTLGGLTPGDARYFQVRGVNVHGEGTPSDAYGVRITRTPYRVLLVDGNDRWARDQVENREQLAHAFMARLGESITPAVRFDSCANDAVIGGAIDLSDYRAVLWHCGEESTVDESFSSTEQGLVAAYLQQGGALFVSGAEIGWDLDWLGSAGDRSFYNSMLRADYVADDAGTEQFEFTGGIFADVPFAVGDFHPTWMVIGFPDVMAPLGGATANLRYISDSGADAGVAGIEYDGSYRLVHLGFPIEAVADGGVRRAMMQRVLGFLLDTEFPDDIVLEARNLAGEVLAPPDADEVGSWLNSVSKSQVPELSGTGSRFIEYDLPNAGSDFATVVPDIPVAGTYEVLVTWGLGANCFDAEYTVNHAEGASVLLVDQIPLATPGANTHTWVSLGEYVFAAGQDAGRGSVTVSEATVTGRPSLSWNQRVYWDALKLVLRERDAIVYGDLDGDGDVDLGDHAVLADCMSGPNQPFGPGCAPADADTDGDVDLADHARFAGAIHAFNP